MVKITGASTLKCISQKDPLVTFPDLSAPSNSSDIGARSGAYSFVDLNHHLEMEDMQLVCPLPLLRVEQLCPCYSLIVRFSQANCKYYTSVGGSMTTGLDGLLDIRQKNDMLNALRFLVEYTGTALLSGAGPGRGIWEGIQSRQSSRHWLQTGRPEIERIKAKDKSRESREDRIHVQLI